MSQTLPISELLAIAQMAGVLQRMAATHRSWVTVDYCPARDAIVVPRELDAGDEGLEPFPIRATPITFQLEDAMFGGTTYVALTCEGRVIIHPFVWESYAKLAKIKIDAVRR